jgi:hypothetical protein
MSLIYDGLGTLSPPPSSWLVAQVPMKPGAKIEEAVKVIDLVATLFLPIMPK